jgi:DNA-binding CsgD family transcriptional regulator
MFKKIKEFSYSVNIEGVVKNLDGLHMKPALNGGGYLYVTLFKDGKRYNKMLHRLVAETFIPNPENKPQVNHIDGNKLNNVIENLEWNTQFENMNHSVEIGSSPRGEKSYLAKLSEKEVIAIRELYAGNVTTTELSDIFGVNRGTISGIVLGKNWKHVGGPISEKIERPRLTKEDIPKIRILFEEGFTNSEIAIKFGLTRGAIQQIRSGRNWSNY